MHEENVKDILADSYNPTYDELMEVKRWLFEEHNKVLEQKAEQQRIYEKFILEKTAFNEDMKRLNSKVLSERKRLKDDSVFFDKKMQILQNGFMQLDLDRKRLERERKEFESLKNSQSASASAFGSYEGTDASLFFRGVRNPLALRKRYRDLLKIFHPDNMSGDEGIVKAINDEYERLKKQEIV